MKASSAAGERRYELDWLRVLAILSVFVYHCTLVFALDPYQIKNGTTYEFLDSLGGFFDTWGMPLIFLISGASAFFALGRTSPGRYLKGLVLRLLVPLVVCMFTHSAVQVYLEQLQTGTFRGSFLDFYPHYFEGLYGFGGNFAWMGMHLWYLEALFLFSLLCLPLYAWLRRSPSGRRSLQGLGSFLARPVAIYLLAVPAYLLFNLLDPRTWGADVFGGWSLFIYLTFFVSGFVIYSHRPLQESIQRSRWISLAAGCVLWTTINPLWGALGDPTFGTPAFAVGTVPWCLNVWCWVLAILGFGMRHLSVRTPLVAYANEAVLPFYILHQTVIVSLGYFVVQWAIPDGIKFACLVSVSFLTCAGLYEFLIRRSNLLRLLFGMKPRAREVRGVRPVLAPREA